VCAEYAIPEKKIPRKRYVKNSKIEKLNQVTGAVVYARDDKRNNRVM
jgi:hypothetical protein